MTLEKMKKHFFFQDSKMSFDCYEKALEEKLEIKRIQFNSLKNVIFTSNSLHFIETNKNSFSMQFN